ncbi:MAG: sugar ABC transporter permease [Thermomicrobiales bacterium]|nr:sugar ABC transporter permease [Thermomicrobiales bacterium]
MSEVGIEVAPLPASTKRGSAWAAPAGAIGRSRERLGWLLILPSLVVVVIVALFPLFETFRLSLTNTRLASAREPRFVGFANYEALLAATSPFWGALRNTLEFTIASVALETILGMIVALVIHSNFKGRGMVRAAILVPWAIPTVVSASMWQWMYHDVFGVINDLLVNRLHILDQKVAWLANPATALPAIIAVDVWKTTPFMALLLLAGLQVIPGDVYEASTVDGANKWQQFWQITLPLIRPALLVALIFRTLDAFRVFDVIYVMKGEASETISLAVLARRELIGNAKLGAGSAISVLIFLCIAALVVLYTRMVRVEEL